VVRVNAGWRSGVGSWEVGGGRRARRLKNLFWRASVVASCASDTTARRDGGCNGVGGID
jgi:hypothetical protein